MCAGKECGTHQGCDCGSCGWGEKCENNQCVTDCGQLCAGEECGDIDGCNCGSCGCGELCSSGTCIFHNCDGKECGGDGCGGYCGSCPSGLSCVDEACTTAVQEVWAKVFGGELEDQVHSLFVDSDGSTYVTGHFQSPAIWFGGDIVSNSSDYKDLFLAKLDADGNHVWSKGFGSLKSDWGYAVVAGPDGSVHAVGEYWADIDFGGGLLPDNDKSDVFVVKLDVDGNHLWSNGFGGDGFMHADSASVDQEGNVYVAGRYDCQVDFGGGVFGTPGGYEMFLLKLDASGNHVWSQHIGGDALEEVTRLLVGPDGDLHLTGFFTSSVVDFGGGPVARQGARDIFVAKMNPDGVLVWAETYGISGPGGGGSGDLLVDPAGDVFVTQAFHGGVDFGGGPLASVSTAMDILLVKLDSEGNHLWSKAFGGTAEDRSWALSVDAVDNVYVAGDFLSDTIDFGGGPLQRTGAVDVFLVKLDSSGDHIWSTHYAAEDGVARGRGVSVNPDGNIYLTGYFEAPSISFGGEPLQSVGEEDIFLVKLSQ